MEADNVGHNLGDDPNDVVTDDSAVMATITVMMRTAELRGYIISDRWSCTAEEWEK